MIQSTVGATRADGRAVSVQEARDARARDEDAFEVGKAVGREELRNELLTEEEHRLAESLGRTATRFSELFPPGDLHEAVHNLHALQNMVLSRAAARAFPDRYRP